jgi:hypothetical protein
MGSVAKSYMTNGLLYGYIFAISSYIRKLFLVYDFATDPIRISLYMRKFFFYQCEAMSPFHRSIAVNT